MRRTLVITTAAAAGGAVLTGILAFGVPAQAAGPGDRPIPGHSRGMGYGTGLGMGFGMGAGMGFGMAGRTAGDSLVGLAQGSLTTDQRTALAGMAEEEKLAHDVYTALGASTKDVRLTRIATAEARHLDQVRALLTRYGIADPTAGQADGVFVGASVQQQYRDLVGRGSASAAAALAVGRDVENADLAALAEARTGVTAADVLTVYDRLTAGSQMHLRAFSA